MSDFESAETIGPYVILEQIGHGGMGEVYRALHPVMNREIALKVTPFRFSGVLGRYLFANEVKISSLLSHPGIARAYDAGEIGHRQYLVCEYVDGSTLEAVVGQNGPLGPKQTLEYVLQVALALLYIHGRGVVHRDVKPSNLVLDRTDTVRLIDFGLASEMPGILPFDHRRLDEPVPQDFLGRYGDPGLDDASIMCPEPIFGDDPGLSRLDSIAGTPRYMSPEQTVSPRVDLRSDIYSLGCTLHYLLTGRPVYAEDTVVAVLRAHRSGHVPNLQESVPGISPAVAALFRKMTALLPDDRYQSAADLIADLEAIVVSLRQVRSVFLSYRRDDSLDATHRLYETLSDRLGAGVVLMDLDGIPPGADFQHFINAAVSGCQIFLVIIGNHWANALDEQGSRRLDQPNDFVRLEIRIALQLNKRVIPVLVGRAAMPTEDMLPVDIRALAFRQAVELRPGPAYQDQMAKLVALLEQSLRSE